MFDRRATTEAIPGVRPRTGLLHVAAWLAAALMILAVAAPVAARPTRECGNDKFELMTMEEFRDLSLSLGVPSEILFSDAWEAGWNSYDKNGDTQLCVKDKPDTAGHLGSWVWNVVDNTANH